jgi:hypothetical protein
MCIAGEDRERLTKGLVNGRAAAADDCIVETGSRHEQVKRNATASIDAAAASLRSGSSSPQAAATASTNVGGRVHRRERPHAACIRKLRWARRSIGTSDSPSAEHVQSD